MIDLDAVLYVGRDGLTRVVDPGYTSRTDNGSMVITSRPLGQPSYTSQVWLVQAWCTLAIAPLVCWFLSCTSGSLVLGSAPVLSYTSLFYRLLFALPPLQHRVIGSDSPSLQPSSCLPGGMAEWLKALVC